MAGHGARGVVWRDAGSLRAAEGFAPYLQGSVGEARGPIGLVEQVGKLAGLG